MYRVNITAGTKLYAVEFSSIEAEVENLESLLQGGEPIILVEDLEDIRLIGIDPELVEVIT